MNTVLRTTWRLLPLVAAILALASASGAQQIAPEAYQQLRYRHIGPVGNRLAAVAGVAGDPLTYLRGGRLRRDLEDQRRRRVLGARLR